MRILATALQYQTIPEQTLSYVLSNDKFCISLFRTVLFRVDILLSFVFTQFYVARFTHGQTRPKGRSMLPMLLMIMLGKDGKSRQKLHKQ